MYVEFDCYVSCLLLGLLRRLPGSCNFESTKCYERHYVIHNYCPSLKFTSICIIKHIGHNFLYFISGVSPPTKLSGPGSQNNSCDSCFGFRRSRRIHFSFCLRTSQRILQAIGAGTRITYGSCRSLPATTSTRSSDSGTKCLDSFVFEMLLVKK